MKRILILSCFLVMFLMTGVEMEASSSHPVGKGMVSSNAHIQSKPADRTTYTVEEYEKLVKDFYEQNIFKQHYEQNIFKQHKVTVSEIDLYRIGKVLGFKEYKIEGADGRVGIPTIDLSCPNICRVFFEKTGSAGEAKTLDEAKEWLLQWCLNKEYGPFDLSDLDEECTAGFMKHLRQMLEDYTGYQRLTSLVAVSALNSTEKHAFVPGFTRIRVSMAKAEDQVGNRYSSNSRGIKIDQEVLKKDEYIINDKGITHSTIFHEITHAYHDMIFGSFDLGDCKSMYSILNSTDADFIGLLFPMLTKERMELAVDHIVELMKNSWDIDVIKSRIRNNKSEEITNIFQKIVDCGLGSLVFPKEDLSPKKDGLKIEDILTDKMLAKAIYVYCCAINGHKSIWTSCEEMLTITGLAPVTDGRRTYLLEDRQNEEIHKVRHQENAGTYAALDDTRKTEKQAALSKEFRYHVAFNAQDVANDVYNELRKISDECVTPLSIDTESIKKLFAEISEKTGSMRDAEVLFKPKKSKFSSSNSDNTAAEPDKEFSKRIFETIEKNLNELQIAILSRNADEVDFLLQKDKTYLDVPCETGKTPLHLAVLNGDVNTTKVLLKHKANPNVPDKEGNTPLHYAVMSENEGAIKALLENSADIKYDSDNETPLHLATHLDKCKAIMTLCTKETLEAPKAPILEAPNKSGYTPLQLAVIYEKVHALRTLLELGANPNVTNTAETPLHTAVRLGNNDLVALLLGYEANVNAKTKGGETERGMTPLHLAAYLEKTESICALLAGIQNKESVLEAAGKDGSYKGMTPLHIAARSGKTGSIYAMLTMIQDKKSLLKTALEAAITGGTPSFEGMTPLHLAACAHSETKCIKGRNACSRELEAITALLHFGADPNAKIGDNYPYKGTTPLCLAVGGQNIPTIEALLASPIIKVETIRDCAEQIKKIYYENLRNEIKTMCDNRIKELEEKAAQSQPTGNP